MNTTNIPSNAGVEPPFDSQRITPAWSATRPFYWSVRRELWENRSIYIAPLAVAAVILFGFLLSMVHARTSVAVSSLAPMRHDDVLTKPYEFAAFMLMGVAFIVALFYCLDALHGERRDRSVLFWKSLPVSDLITVLSKASIPVVILPLLTFAITIATQMIMLLLNTAIVAARGGSVGALWMGLPMFQMSLMLLFHLVAIHGLWYAPFYGWLLLVSGWARRATVLWAVLPLVAIGVIEKLAFNTSYFALMLHSRFLGNKQDTSPTQGSVLMDPVTLHTLGKFLSSPGLWVGLAITAVFLFAAARQRRYREPI